MPKYYELDVICEVFSDILHISERDIEEILDKAPTEDVVPKSEYEKLSIELEAMRGAANSYKIHYENAKQEVAREIFEEASKRFEVLLKDYPCEGDLVSAKKFLDFHWKPIVRSIMADYAATSKRNT